MTRTPTGSWDPPEPDVSHEAARIQRLFRVMSAFVLWPAASAGIAIWMFPGAHGNGLLAYYVLAAVLGVVLWVAAPWLGRRFGEPEG